MNDQFLNTRSPAPTRVYTFWGEFTDSEMEREFLGKQLTSVGWHNAFVLLGVACTYFLFGIYGDYLLFFDVERILPLVACRLFVLIASLLSVIYWHYRPLYWHAVGFTCLSIASMSGTEMWRVLAGGELALYHSFFTIVLIQSIYFLLHLPTRFQTGLGIFATSTQIIGLTLSPQVTAQEVTFQALLLISLTGFSSYFSRSLQKNTRVEYRNLTQLNQEVARRKQVEHDLLLEASRLRLAEEVAGIGHWQFKVGSRRVYWSENVYKIHGMEPSEEQVLIADGFEAYHPDDRAAVTEHIQNAVETKGGFSFELRLVRVDGVVRYVFVRGLCQLNAEQEVVAIFGVIQDVTERKETEEQLRKLANTDYLTGALNRRSFLERGNEEFLRNRRYESPFCLLMLDLDHFKSVNDNFGHLAGDEVLRSFVRTLRESLRNFDIIGRMGGEEFAVLLPETVLADGKMIANRLQNEVSQIRVDSEHGPMQVTVSIGLTAAMPKDQTLDHTYSRADSALYRAKHLGRNCVVVAEESEPPVT